MGLHLASGSPEESDRQEREPSEIGPEETDRSHLMRHQYRKTA
jgi:hypothetical protein